LVARQNLREAAAVIRKTNVFTTHTPVPAATTVPAVAGG
jgi:glucan phosphorylase